MAQCLHCSHKFHACHSCGLNGWEWDYCHTGCYEAAGEPPYCWDCDQKVAVGPLIDTGQCDGCWAYDHPTLCACAHEQNEHLDGAKACCRSNCACGAFQGPG